MMIEKKYFGKGLSWAGIVAAESACTVFIKPRAFSLPLLVLKGGQSHYTPMPCITMIKLYQNAGAKVELIIFPKSNHFFLAIMVTLLKG